MDKFTTYFIDENVIKILFGETDSQKIMGIQDKVDSEAMSIIQETVVRHLLTKGLSEEQARFISDADWEALPQEWQNLLKDIELLTKINSATEIVYKRYYVELFPKLSTEKQESLINYVNSITAAAQVVAENKDEIQNTINEMMQKYGASTQEELLAKIQTEKATIPMAPSTV